MKQQFFRLNNIVKAFFISGLLLQATIPVFAKENKKEVAAAITTQPNVQYLGSDNTSSRFAVQFNTSTPVTFDVIIKDASGYELYRNKFEASKFNKVFQLVNENGDNADLSFFIHVAGGKDYEFTVNNTVDYVKEIQISKI